MRPSGVGGRVRKSVSMSAAVVKAVPLISPQMRDVHVEGTWRLGGGGKGGDDLSSALRIGDKSRFRDAPCPNTTE